MVASVLMMLVVFGILVVGLVVALVVERRKHQAEAGPRCGECGYNLTGATSNRCPECGELFIDAGVITKPVKPPRVTASVAIAIGLLGGLAALFAVHSVARRAAVRPAVLPLVTTAPAASTQPFIQRVARPEEQSP